MPSEFWKLQFICINILPPETYPFHANNWNWFFRKLVSLLSNREINVAEFVFLRVSRVSLKFSPRSWTLRERPELPREKFGSRIFGSLIICCFPLFRSDLKDELRLGKNMIAHLSPGVKHVRIASNASKWHSAILAFRWMVNSARKTRLILIIIHKLFAQIFTCVRW